MRRVGCGALALFQQLTARGVDAYYDLESGQALGQFDTRILNQIAARPYFLLVLTPGTLDRCPQPGDWLWREIDHALSTNRVIVPMMTTGFDFADADRWLPPAAAARLRSFNGVELSQTWFTQAVQGLTDELLVPVQVDIVPVSADDEARARRATELAANAPTVTTKQLAEETRMQAAVATDDRRRAVAPDLPPRSPMPRRGRILAVVACLAVVIALGALAAAQLGGGDDDDDDTAPTTRVETGTTGPAQPAASLPPNGSLTPGGPRWHRRPALRPADDAGGRAGAD